MMWVRFLFATSSLMLTVLLSDFSDAQVIRMQVLNEARRPASNATVFFAPVGNQGVLLASPQRAKTDENGTVTLFISPLWHSSGWSAQAIAFWARKGELESSTEYFDRSARIWGIDDLPTLTLYLRSTETFSAQIRLVDETGIPVPNCWVALLARIRKAGEMTNWIAFWRTNKNGEVKGTFRLRRLLVNLLGDEIRFFLIAWHPQKGWAWRSCNLIELRNMKISLSPPQPVTMRFKNCFGEPVAGIKGRLAQIFLPDLPYPIPLPPDPFAFASNKEGVLTVPLPKGIKGSWEWHSETPAEILRQYRPQGNFLSLSPGTHWDIQFHQGVTSVTGTLIDAETRNPLPQCPLLIEFHTGEFFSAVGTYWHRTFTDEQGRFKATIRAPLLSLSKYLRGGFIALHLPDGQRFALKLDQQKKQLPGCWRISFPSLTVKPLTGQLTAKANLKVSEPFIPKDSERKETEKALRRTELEFRELVKRAEVFIAIRALQREQTPQSIFAEAINCEGQKLTLEFVRYQDGVGIAVIIPPSQPVKLRLGDGEWVVVAFIAWPDRRNLQHIPVGAHFFASLEGLEMRLSKFNGNIQKLELPPNQTREVSLFAIAGGNLFVYRPEALQVEFPKK